MTNQMTKILWNVRSKRARLPQYRDYSLGFNAYFERPEDLNVEACRERVAAFANEMGTHPERRSHVEVTETDGFYCFRFKVHYARPSDIPKGSQSGVWDRLDELVR